MSNLDEINFFADASLLANPHLYFEHLRAKGPVVVVSPYDVVAVTGYDEGLAVYRDSENFSSINVSFGPIPPMPFRPEGDDITDQIERHRYEIPGGETVVALDPPSHTRTKSLLMGIITPKRFKENEEFLWRLADQQLDEFMANGSVEIVSQYARPFTTLAVAELLGAPAHDFDKIRNPVSHPGQIGVGSTGAEVNPFERIAGYFTEYVELRRHEPRQDVMGQMAQLRYADGSLPAIRDIVSVATILFAAGGDTTTQVIAAALRVLAEDSELQRKIRNERHLIPHFIEEMLRLYGTVKSDFRLVKKPVRMGELDVRPGTVVMLLVGAMNRDPRRFDKPHELRLDRKNGREHVAFGRGIHACAGAPLARAELKVTLDRILDRISDVRIDEERHGPPEVRRYEYLQSYLLQGVRELHLRFDKI